MKELEVYIMVGILKYGPHTVLSKTIIKRTTGNITVSSYVKGEELAINIYPFANFIQIIDGAAEIIINRKKYKLKLGEGIIIPAFSKYYFKAGINSKWFQLL